MSRIHTIILILLFACYALYERTRMLTLDISDAFVGNDLTTWYILGCILLSLISIVIFKSPANRNHFSAIFCTLLAIIYLISLFHSLTYPIGARNQYGEILMPLTMFLAVSRIEISDKSRTLVLWSVSIITLFLVYTFYSEYISINLLDIGGQNNASYYELYFLPLLLCHKRKSIRIIAIAIIILVVLFSLKRGGFLALMLALAVYFYFEEIKIKNYRMKTGNIFLLIFAIFLIAYIVVNINNHILDGKLLERMEAIAENGGSGRLDIYKSYLAFIDNSPIEAILLGRGWRGSIRDSGIEYTCHNDFLECFIDFGILGFILYIALYISLLKQFHRMVKSKHEYAPAMGASIALFFMNAMVSHILIYPWYMTTFALFWGFIIASTRQNITNNIEN